MTPDRIPFHVLVAAATTGPSSAPPRTHFPRSTPRAARLDGGLALAMDRALAVRVPR